MKSLVALSMHKAGSTITDRILTRFCSAKGYEIDLLDYHLEASPLEPGDFLVGFEKSMRAEDVYYGIIRGPFGNRLTRLGEFRIIVQLRDPRDCITSAYFSFGKSHKPPEDPVKARAFHERRGLFLSVDIDTMTLQMVENYRIRMQVLADIIDVHEDVLVLKYEDMVLNTEHWLGQIAGFLDQPLTDELRRKLGDDIDFSIDSEDSSRHKRQVLPGDHTRKLKPETIARMNEVLADVLRRFDYPT